MPKELMIIFVWVTNKLIKFHLTRIKLSIPRQCELEYPDMNKYIHLKMISIQQLQEIQIMSWNFYHFHPYIQYGTQAITIMAGHSKTLDIIFSWFLMQLNSMEKLFYIIKGFTVLYWQYLAHFSYTKPFYFPFSHRIAILII